MATSEQVGKTAVHGKTGNADRAYRTDIDGIRSLAILSVVLFHAGIPGLSGGFTGVDVFFVLSGYLIGGHIFSELQSGRFSYLRFYQRRAKRILPAFYAVLAFILISAFFLFTPLNIYHTVRSSFWATLSVSNIAFWQQTNYFAPGAEMNPLLMTWSLGVEEQFYIIIPLLMVLLARVQRKWVLPSILAVCVGSFLYAVFSLAKYPSAAFYLLPSRAWELGVGVALAVVELERARYARRGVAAETAGLAGLIAIVLPFALYSRTTPFPGAAALPSVLGTALLLAVPQSWVSRRILSLPPLVYIGRISYSWYLWHWPVLAVLRVIYGRSALPLPIGLIAVAAALGMAVLSYYGIEQPFRQSKSAPKPLLLRYAAVTLALLLVCGFMVKEHGFPRRYPMLAAMETVTSERGSDPCLVTDGVSAPNLAAACYPRGEGRPQVALWGDSHSGAMAPGMRAAAERSGYGFVQLGKLACLPLLGAVRYTPGLPQETPECIAFNAETLKLLQADANVRVVVLCGFWANPFRLRVAGEELTWLTPDETHERTLPTLESERALFEQALRHTVETLRSAGKQVLVLGDTPSFTYEPIWKVATDAIPAQRLLTDWLRVPEHGNPGYAAPGFQQSDRYADSALHAALNGLDGVSIVEVKAAMCSASEECFYRQGEKLFYADAHHLTADGALYALRDLHIGVGVTAR
ncbi:MAG TPA: acyltransferase family protein [Acidobacteriaceae bacterium]